MGQLHLYSGQSALYPCQPISRWTGILTSYAIGTAIAIWLRMTNKQSSGSLLAPDDLRVGAYVALHSLLATPRQPLEEPELRPHIRPRRDAPVLGYGMPVQIRAVSLPFLVCAILQPGGAHSGPAILDLREVRLIGVSRQFVRAIAGFEQAAGGARKDAIPQEQKAAVGVAAIGRPA